MQKPNPLLFPIGQGLSRDSNKVPRTDWPLLKNVIVAPGALEIEFKDLDLNGEFCGFHIVATGIRLSGNIGTGILLSGDNGANYVNSASSNLNLQFFVNDAGSTGGASANTTYSYLTTTTAAAAATPNNHISFTSDIINPYTTNDNARINTNPLARNSAGNNVGGFVQNSVMLQLPVNAFKMILASAGSYQAGQVLVYGKRKRNV